MARQVTLRLGLSSNLMSHFEVVEKYAEQGMPLIKIGVVNRQIADSCSAVAVGEALTFRSGRDRPGGHRTRCSRAPNKGPAAGLRDRTARQQLRH